MSMSNKYEAVILLIWFLKILITTTSNENIRQKTSLQRKKASVQFKVIKNSITKANIVHIILDVY